MGDWLDRGGFSQYRSNFSANHITGKNVFDLTEDDLENELNIKDHGHRKRIFKDIQFLKKIYSKNPDEADFIRKKLLRFYEKNQGELFAKKSQGISQEPVNIGGVLLDPSQIQSTNISKISHINVSLGEITVHNRNLKDVNDRKDNLDDSMFERNRPLSSSSSSGSESSSSSEEAENKEAFEKRSPTKKGKTTIPIKPVERDSEDPGLQMSEYRSNNNTDKSLFFSNPS